MHYSMEQSVHYIWPWGLALEAKACAYLCFTLLQSFSKQAARLTMEKDQCLHATHGLVLTKQIQPSERKILAPSVSVQSDKKF